MWHTLLSDARFHESLLELDRQIAAEARARGCPVCGEVLHGAAYPRKPRGGPLLTAQHDLRLSFCCAREGCRRRVTPPSVRFLGRRVYAATIFVVVTLLRHGPSRTRIRDIQELVGVSRRAVERWCKWWRGHFIESAFWKTACAGFVPAVAAARLPSSLMERFLGEPEGRLVALLRFLGPISGGAKSIARAF